MEYSADELRAAIQDLNRAITHCIESGSVLVAQYTAASTGGMRCDVLAERFTSGGMMMLPINIMISDSRGETALVLIGPNGQSQMIDDLLQ